MIIKGAKTVEGILTERTVVDIDEKIAELIKWSQTYPKAELNNMLRAHDALESYAGKDKNKLAELLAQYARMQEYYAYVRNRRAQRKLRDEQEKRCKEGNIRGAFGYPTATEDLAKKYRITPDKVDSILSEYGDVGKCMVEYINSNEKFPEFDFMRKCLLIDVNETTRGNSAYTQLYKAIISFQDEDILLKGNIVFYDGQDLKDALDTLPDRDKNVISLRFGLVDGREHTLEEIASKCGVTRERIRQIESAVKKKLKRIIRSKKIYDLRDNQKLQFSDEEREKIDSLTKRLYTSNIIFVPDEQYSKEPDDISLAELIEILRELQKVQDDYEKRKLDEKNVAEKKKIDISGIDIVNISIEKLGLSYGILNRLRGMNIHTVLELIRRKQWDQLYVWEGFFMSNDIPEINSKLEDFSRRTNLVKERDDGLWMTEIGNSGVEVDVGTYLKLRTSGITTDDQAIALKKVCSTGVIRKIGTITDEEFNTLMQIIYGGQSYDENNLVLRNMGITSSEHMKALKTLGIERVENIRNAGLSNDEIEILESLSYGPEYSGGKHIRILNFSTRAYNALKGANIMTVGALMKKSKEDLMKIRNMGKKSLDEIERKLAPLREKVVEGTSDDSPLTVAMHTRQALEEKCNAAAANAAASENKYKMLEKAVPEH